MITKKNEGNLKIISDESVHQSIAVLTRASLIAAKKTSASSSRPRNA
jgi:hypothetical protein